LFGGSGLWVMGYGLFLGPSSFYFMATTSWLLPLAPSP